MQPLSKLFAVAVTCPLLSIPHGMAFARDVGFPLPCDGWTDVGPPFSYFHWVHLVVDLAVALGSALLVGIVIEVIIRRRKRIAEKVTVPKSGS
jgi:hypothetical protein